MHGGAAGSGGRTGTSQNGVIHRYYTCSTKARQGETGNKDGE